MKSFAIVASLLLATATVPAAIAQDKHSWDNLLRVKAKKMDAVYLLPQADFRGYTKVMLDPTQVAMRKDWKRDRNNETVGIFEDVTDRDVTRILTEARTGFEKLLREAYTKAGYQIVTEPAADVLRIETAVVDIDVEAQDTMSAGMTRVYTHEAGGAVLVVEARDSVTGAVLGRAVDGDTTGDLGPYLRNRATNTGEFEQLFSHWAKVSVDGLAELKQLSPVDAQGRLAKR